MLSLESQTLIKYVIALVSEKGLAAGRTRLLKLLYLIDVYNKKFHGKKLTDIEWVYYFYGPYSNDVNDYLRNIGLKDDIEKSDFKTTEGHTAYAYRSKIKSEDCLMQTESRYIVKQVVDEWLFVDLNDLLNFVYFETEPMQNVDKRGSLLNFETITPFEKQKIIPVVIDHQKLHELRSKIDKESIGRSFFEEYEKILNRKVSLVSDWDEHPSDYKIKGKGVFKGNEPKHES